MFQSEMIPEALIPVVTSVITGVLAMIAAYYKGIYMSDVVLHKRQLDELYAPLVKMVMQSQGDIFTKRKDEVSKLLYTHHMQAAPALLDAWRDCCNDGVELEIARGNFSVALFSNYNWVKKCLGYPYKEKEIIYDYVPVRGFDRRMFIPCFIGLGVSFLLMLAVFLCSQNETYKMIGFFVLACYIFVFLVLLSECLKDNMRI